jgi:hypothetical protein
LLPWACNKTCEIVRHLFMFDLIITCNQMMASCCFALRGRAAKPLFS